MENLGVNIVCVVGFKNSGKTTMVRKIVENLTAKKYNISTIKHAHHGFDIDKPGRDSFLHRKAGAREVVILSSERFALLHENLENEEPPEIEDIISKMSPCDLIVAEGFRHYDIPKIEVRRKSAKMRPLNQPDKHIIALVADHKIGETNLPVFDIDDVEAISNFIIHQFDL